MPLGHALMILMEHLLDKQALYCVAFVMGAVGLVLTIVGVFVNGDTRQTLFGLLADYCFGRLDRVRLCLFCQPFGVQPLIDAAGEVITKPNILLCLHLSAFG